MVAVKIAVIGGSGLDDPQLLANRIEKNVETPFGFPSDSLICGNIDDVPCVLLARHGMKHTFNPTNVPYRANLWALKQEGCTHVLATSACGSLQEHARPGEFFLVDQFIDRTQRRLQTFYDGKQNHPCQGCLHMPMDTPFCPVTSRLMYEAALELKYNAHLGGTVVTIEGPRFSSRAESRLFHSWGADLINMSTVPEVVLARELGLCYALLAMVTDYDSWHDALEPVSVAGVLDTFRKNSVKAIDVIQRVIPKIASKDWSKELQANEVRISVKYYQMLFFI